MHLQAWLVRIMRSLFSHEYRRSTRRPDEWLSQDITGWELDAYYRHTQQPDPTYERFIGAPCTDEVRRAMSALPDCLSRALYHAVRRRLRAQRHRAGRTPYTHALYVR